MEDNRKISIAPDLPEKEFMAGTSVSSFMEDETFLKEN
jgi:hypothetical protein